MDRPRSICRAFVLAAFLGGSTACTTDSTADSSPVLATGADDVTVEVSGQNFGAGDTLAVTITNGLEQSIWTYDQMSWCAIVSIEHLSGDNWSRIEPCNSLSPPTVVELQAGTSTAARFVLQTSSRGDHRVTLLYSTDEGFSFESSRVAVSTKFTIE